MSGTRIACWHDRVVGSAACKGAVLLLPALLVALLGWVLSLRGLAQAHQAALQQGQGALQQLAAGSREAAAKQPGSVSSSWRWPPSGRRCATCNGASMPARASAGCSTS